MAAILHDLSDELQSLVRTLGSELADVVPLSSAGYAGYRPNAFRLRFADGREVKGRELGNWQRAAAVEYVLGHVHHPGLPRLLARAGRALITEWVDGRPLTAADCTPALVQQCGELLGFIHAVPVPDQNPFERRDPIDAWHRRCERDLSALVAADVLGEAERRHAFDVAIRHAPPTDGAAGFVHRDFCAENIIVRPSGEIAIVDNETMGIDEYDFDLGRTWYRWLMTRDLREAFWAGYNCHRTAERFIAHGVYWAIVALADAAVFRLKKHAGATDAPLARLRALLHEVDRSAGSSVLLSC